MASDAANRYRINNLKLRFSREAAIMYVTDRIASMELEDVKDAFDTAEQQDADSWVVVGYDEDGSPKDYEITIDES